MTAIVNFSQKLCLRENKYGGGDYGRSPAGAAG